VAVDNRRAGAVSPRKSRPPEGSASGAAFQSIVDATVSTDAVVHALFDQLESNGSELVLFDINRLSDGAVHRSGGRHDPVAAHGQVATTLRALARHERESGFARGGRALDPPTR
jgi:hypothetical protein